MLIDGMLNNLQIHSIIFNAYDRMHDLVAAEAPERIGCLA